jgi:hypothetical protein
MMENFRSNKRRILLGRPRCRWEDMIKIDLTDVGSEERDCVCLTIRSIGRVMSTRQRTSQFREDAEFLD